MRRKTLFGGTAVVAVVAICLAASVAAPDSEIEIGPSQHTILFETYEAIHSKPVIDLSLAGNRLRFPKRVSEIEPAWISDDWAGAIRIDVSVSSATWIISGIEIGANVVLQDDKNQTLLVPYAPSEDLRDAILRLDDEPVQVKLPYKEDMAPKLLPPVQFTAGPYLVVAKPSTRPIRPMEMVFDLEFQGPSKHCLFQAEPVGKDPYWFASKAMFSTNEGTNVSVPWGERRVFKGSLSTLKTEFAPVTVTTHVTGKQTVSLSNGVKLISEGRIKLAESGYICMLLDGEFMWDSDSRLDDDVFFPKNPQTLATLIKVVDTYPLEFTLDNTRP
jgi:hypothetical protein